MALQLSIEARNRRLDVLEELVGTGAKLQLRTGPAPVNTAAVATGILLAEIALPADWMAPAADGQKIMAGTWMDDAAVGAGEAGHYRVLDSEGACHLQGTATEEGEGGDLQLKSTTFVVGQGFTITQFSLTEPNG